jgi:hypothetical protein
MIGPAAYLSVRITHHDRHAAFELVPFPERVRSAGGRVTTLSMELAGHCRQRTPQQHS